MTNRHFFFCGIGGSGMLPLALILKAHGQKVSGSDRSRDQGLSPEKFAFLEAQNIDLYPQDGSGLSPDTDVIVASAAIEETVPDILAAERVGATRLTRAETLARLFNGAGTRIGVGGTSGKSTTTGMIAHILTQAGHAPTVMNGAVMNNFVTSSMPYASAVTGRADLFVSELDESDGSIALFAPTIAVLNNISVDHKTLEELTRLFADFTEKADTPILNANDPLSAPIVDRLDDAWTFGIDTDACLRATNLVPAPTSISCTITCPADGLEAALTLPVPGHHNVSNALAALSAARAAGVPLEAGTAALGSFAGIRRRFDIVGTKNDITVIDDFGHNPDKIAATLRTLHDFPGRLLIYFQPHGFGPLRKMKDAFVDCFAGGLGIDDVLLMPPPAYFGGTVDRSVDHSHIIDGIRKKGANAMVVPDRQTALTWLTDEAKPGDRIIIMGARDDTLSDFARQVLGAVS